MKNDLLKKKAEPAAEILADEIEVKKKEDGILPEIPEKLSGALMEGAWVLLVMLAGWSFVHVFTTAFGFTVHVLPFLAELAAVAVTVRLLIRKPKAGLIAFLTLVAAALLLGVIMRKTLVRECTALYSGCSKMFNEHYGLTEVLSEEGTEQKAEVTGIMMLFSVIPCWQMAHALERSVKPVLPAFFFLIPLFIDIIGGTAPALLPMAGSAFVILSVFIAGRSGDAGEEEGKPAPGRNQEKLLKLFFALFASVIFMALSAGILYPVLKPAVEKMEESYSPEFYNDLLASLKNNPLHLSRDGLSDGNLSRAGSVVRNGETVMTVTLDHEIDQAMYLRGFAADTYTGRSWDEGTSLTSDAWPATVGSDDIYGESVSENIYRDPLLYYAASSALAIRHDASEKNAVTISEKNSGKRAYLPYFVCGKLEGDTASLFFTQDLTLKTKKRALEVTYPVWSYEGISDVISRTDENAGATGTLQPDGTAVVCYMDAEELYETLKSDYGFQKSFAEFSSDSYGEYVLTDENGTEIHCRVKDDALTEYEACVREADLQIPEDCECVREIADELAEAYGIDTEDPDIPTCVGAVQRYLSENMTYDLKPGETGSGKDFVTDFLVDRKTGYCVHFATAGTLILRALGVPARYVEGYYVPAEEGVLVQELTDYNAHAWTEVFIQDFGWYPVEMTLLRASEEDGDEQNGGDSGQDDGGSEADPGDETASESGDEGTQETVYDDPSAWESASWSLDSEPTNMSGNGNGSAAGNDTAESPVPQEGGTESDPEIATRSSSSGVLFIILLILTLLLALGIPLLIHVLRRRIIPLDKFRGEDHSETTRKIYRAIERQARRSGRPISPDDTAEEIMKKWPEIPEETVRTMQTVIKAACYAGETVSENCPAWLHGVYESRVFEKRQKKKKSEEI